MGNRVRPRLKKILRGTVTALAGGMAAMSAAAGGPNPTSFSHQADLVIVAGTPAGIMAAIAAARYGCTVLVLERTSHLGGLPANGLGATDIGTRGATGGLFLEFVRRIHQHYLAAGGRGSGLERDCEGGYHFEPSVAEKVLEGMVSEQPRVTVLRLRQFDALPENVFSVDRKIRAVRVLNRANGMGEWMAGKIFVDATYEGDLAAAAGVPYRLGREDARAFNEPMAGQLYKYWDGPVATGSSGLGDNAIQAYNYRLTLTRISANRLPIDRPQAYRRDDYLSLVDDIREDVQTGRPGARRPEWDWNGIGRVVNMVALPNGKTDANNQHASFVSTDLPEENWPWATSSWAWRDRFAMRLRDYSLGLIWFCQHDPALSPDFRSRCLEWGLARDEYADNGNFPRQVYVREGRRIVGEYLFTAHDVLPVKTGSRPPVHRDSITASHYALDSHAVRKREANRVHLDGFFSWPTAPYTVPYGIIVPTKVDGLLVPVAASATHVAFSTLRMEPCWMALGEAAGTAAGVAIETGKDLRQIDLPGLQLELLRHGAVLIYFRDVKPDDPHYLAIQFLGLRGILSGWEVDPDRPVKQDDVAAWCRSAGLPDLPFSSGEKRGDFLQALWNKILVGR